MKRLLSALCALMASISLVSCYSDSYLGFDDMDVEPLYASSIVSCGNNTIIEYSDGQRTYIDVDPVRSLTEIIELEDTCVLSPEKVDWANDRISCRAKLLNREVKYACDRYVVYLCTYQLDVYKSGVIVPIKFTRERVYAVNKQGDEFTSDCYFQFGMKGRYVGSEPMVTFEESHSRSYYDVLIDVYDKDELIGNMQVRISFYTANTPISFSAVVSDCEA